MNQTVENGSEPHRGQDFLPKVADEDCATAAASITAAVNCQD